MLDRDKNVSDEAFWANRIKNAQRVGDIRHAVFRAPEKEWQKIKNDHIRILNRYINLRDKVLDAGCGYGRLYDMVNISEKYNGSYTGVDISSDFINLAKQKFPKGNFLQGDLKALPFKDNQFDIVVCVSLMIMIVQNLGWFEWEKIQNELLRVSDRGILCLEYGITDTYTTSDTYYIITKQ